MARLDDTNAHAALEQSRAQLTQLEAVLTAATVAAADARPIFLRNQRELADGLISQDIFDASKASYDAAQTAVAVAERNVAVARATVEVNQRYEDDTIIRAPFDGVVTVRTAQPATVTLNAYPEWRIPAGVIAVIPTADRAKATVKVRIGFKVKDPCIPPEMGAHVSFLEDVAQGGPAAASRPATVTVLAARERK